MTDATLGLKEVQALAHPRDPFRLVELTRTAEHLAGLVEAQWAELAPDVREALTAWAYSKIEPSRTAPGLWSVIRWRGIMAWLGVTGKEGVLNAYLNAMNRLTDVVLDAIEREDPEYAPRVAEAVSEALATLETDQGMTAEEARARLRRLADDAFRGM